MEAFSNSSAGASAARVSMGVRNKAANMIGWETLYMECLLYAVAVIGDCLPPSLVAGLAKCLNRTGRRYQNCCKSTPTRSMMTLTPQAHHQQNLPKAKGDHQSPGGMSHPGSSHEFGQSGGEGSHPQQGRQGTQPETQHQ